MAFVNAILDMSSSSENDGPGLDSDSDPELETDSLSRTSWADKSLESGATKHLGSGVDTVVGTGLGVDRVEMQRSNCGFCGFRLSSSGGLRFVGS